jgi:hypothetical protein
MALSRHVTWSGEGDDAHFTVHALPVRDRRENKDMLELLCTAVVGVLTGANQIIQGPQAGEGSMVFTTISEN